MGGQVLLIVDFEGGVSTQELVIGECLKIVDGVEMVGDSFPHLQVGFSFIIIIS